MKKDRNSFFSQYGVTSYQNQQFPNIPFPQTGIPQMNSNINYSQNSDYNLDSRISKLEREISRLDSRVSQLESNNKIQNGNVTNTDYNFANSMYMV